jgi:hypothetical protein
MKTTSWPYKCDKNAHTMTETVLLRNLDIPKIQLALLFKIQKLNKPIMIYFSLDNTVPHISD